MMRQRAAVPIAVICAAVLLGVNGASSAGASDALKATPPDVVGISVHPRKPFAYGEVVLLHRSERHVKLESLRLLDASPGLRLLRADALGPKRRFDGQRFFSDAVERSWPGGRINPLRPLEGHPVATISTRKGRHWGVELWLKLEVPKNGPYKVSHFELTYEVGGATKTLDFAHTLLACGRRHVQKYCTPHSFHQGTG
jgi:hypothetical protein